LIECTQAVSSSFTITIVLDFPAQSGRFSISLRSEAFLLFP